MELKLKKKIMEGSLIIKKVLGDNILVKVDSPNHQSKGGVFISSLVPKYGNTGEVIACGPKVTEVKPNQRIQFHPLSVIDGVEGLGDGLFFIKQSNIELIYD